MPTSGSADRCSTAQDLVDDAGFGFTIVGAFDYLTRTVASVADELRARVGDAPVYVSIDIDVLDPAHAPGTGTPEAGGMTSRELLATLRGLAGINVVGADVVEVAPAYDHAEITAIAAANVVYELLGDVRAAMTTLRALASKVRAREIGAHELVARSFRRIETFDADLGAVVALRSEALAEARLFDEQLAAGGQGGPLAGLPLLVKDMTDVAGLRTTFGSRVFATAPAATTDAVVVARLRAAGAIVVGKTNLPEFAAEGFTSNDLFGTTRNPWNPERTCGGSSGGSAVALAAGMAAIATATDGGGSIRIPAAYCGLVGLKPTNGVIGRDPIPDWIDLSTDGPFSTQADDLEVLLDVLRGPTPGDPSTQEARPSERDPSIGRVFSIERFTDFGPLPTEAAEPFAAASARFAEVFDRVDRTGDAGTAVRRSAYGRRLVQHLRRRARPPVRPCVVRRAPGRAHALDPVLLRGWLRLPDGGVSGRAPPSLRVRPGARRSARRRRGVGVARHGDGRVPRGGREEGTGADPYVCAAQNITGHPALSVPAGFYPSGVPFGLQVTAPRFRDDLLLDVAKRWEQAQPWPLTAPGYEPFA